MKFILALKDFGVLSTLISDGITYTDIKPNGPLFNEIFRLNAEYETVWASFGDYSRSLLIPHLLRARGLSYLKG
jgi:hypothetical protein